MSETIRAAQEWTTNADLIVDVAALGYLRKDWRVLDPTYGSGTWWKRWRPDDLVCSDIDPDSGVSVDDFTDLPYPDGYFDAVAYDPPYKLNGTPTEEVDARYGVHEVRTWQQRHALMRAGLDECARVLGKGYLLAKCQDQVCSGAVRWQTDMLTEQGEEVGLRKVDAFYMLGTTREQPMKGRKQRHAHGKPSMLLVFRKGGR